MDQQAGDELLRAVGHRYRPELLVLGEIVVLVRLVVPGDGVLLLVVADDAAFGDGRMRGVSRHVLGQCVHSLYPASVLLLVPGGVLHPGTVDIVSLRVFLLRLQPQPVEVPEVLSGLSVRFRQPLQRAVHVPQEDPEERLAYEIEREIGGPVHLPVLRHVALREKDVKMGVPAEVPSVGVEEGDVAEPSSFPLCCVGSVPRQKEIQSLLCGAEKDVQHRIPVFPHQRPEIGRDGEDHLPVGDVRQRLRHAPRYPFPCQLTAGGTEAGLACPADHHRLSAVRTDVHDEA